MTFIIIFAVLAALCLIYFVIIVSYGGIGTAFAFAWAVAAVVFAAVAVLWYVFRKHHIRLPGWLTVTILAFAGVILAAFIFVETNIVVAMGHKPSSDLDYVIVLGAQVRGTRVTRSLAKRLDKACEYLTSNPGTMCIVSGGKGSGEDISEAEAMYDYLVSAGIDSSRIIMENRSTSTMENIQYSMDMVPDGAKVGVISNNFHVYRATLVCKKLGYEAEGIAAGADEILFLNYMVREFAAIVRYVIGGMV